MNRKRLKIFLLLLLAYVFLIYQWPYFQKKYYLFRLDRRTKIAHGLGKVDGFPCTNSVEAFVHNYRRGFRVFEADLRMTRDGEIVAYHAGSMRDLSGQKTKISELSRDEFMARKKTPPFSPVDLEMILELLKKYPDSTLLTDIKSDFGPTMEKINQKLNSGDPTLRRRIIPQIYAEDQLALARKVFPDSQVVYTLYRSNAPDRRVLEFVAGKDRIFAVTVSKERFSPAFAHDLRKLGKQVFVHTLNDEDEIYLYLRSGASGIYTDSYF